MELTLVTAYFDIGRGNFTKYNRTNNKYIDYFKFWARIKNKLVVYTSPEFADSILEIRKNFGLSDRTIIKVINDFRQIDSDLYARINHTMNNTLSLNFHKETDHLEAYNPDYNYITSIKYYFVADAVENNYAKGMISWIDFGFNHGGVDGLIKTKEFNFLWQYNFDNKIHLFSYNNIDYEQPIFDVVRSMDVYIRGNIMIAPDHLWLKFKKLARESMVALTKCGLCDDDQTISLMAYYEKPSIFIIHPANNWYDGLKNFGGEHLTVRKNSPIKQKPYNKLKDKAIAFFSYGKYKTAFKYYKKYMKERVLSKLLFTKK